MSCTVNIQLVVVKLWETFVGRLILWNIGFHKHAEIYTFKIYAHRQHRCTPTRHTHSKIFNMCSVVR